MAKKATEVRRIIQRYVGGLQQHIRVDKVILFGSYANGRPNEWSDIDLAIISPDFDGLSMLKRLALMAKARPHRDIFIEALGYGNQEHETADRQTFLGQIKRTGKVVYQARPPKRRTVKINGKLWK